MIELLVLIIYLISPLWLILWNIILKDSIDTSSQTPPSKSTRISDKTPPQADKEAIPNKSIETPPVSTYSHCEFTV